MFVLLIVAVLFAVAQSSGPLAGSMTVQKAQRSGFTYRQIRLWGALSFALTTMVAGYVYDLTGIGLAFVVYAALSIFFAVISVQLPKTPATNQLRETVWKGTWNVYKDAYLLVFIIICFFLASALTMNFTYLPLYLETLHNPIWGGSELHGCCFDRGAALLPVREVHDTLREHACLNFRECSTCCEVRRDGDESSDICNCRDSSLGRRRLLAVLECNGSGCDRYRSPGALRHGADPVCGHRRYGTFLLRRISCV